MNLKKRGSGDAEEKAPLDEGKPKSKKKSQQSVIIYLTILFTVAFLLVLLSYFMQQRRNEDAMTDLTQEHTRYTEQAQQDIENLQAVNTDLEEQNADQQEQIEFLQEEMQGITEECEELQEQIEILSQEIIEYSGQAAALRNFTMLFGCVLSGDNEGTALYLEITDKNYSQYLEGDYADFYWQILSSPDEFGIEEETVEEYRAKWVETHPEYEMKEEEE